MGPGIFDMKANCALAISILHACDDLKINTGTDHNRFDVR